MPAKKLSVPKPERNKDGSVTFYLQVAHATPDGVQYKPYSTQFVPLSPVYVRVTAAAEHVLEFGADKLILSPRGWFMVAKQIATGATLAAGAQ